MRQFANSDRSRFAAGAPTQLQDWLATVIESAEFTKIMQKHPLWSLGMTPLLMPAEGDANNAAPENHLD